MANLNQNDWSRLVEDAMWAKKCNMAYDQASHNRKLILRNEFKVGQKVLLFNSRLKLITGKLRSKWDGPFVVTNIFPYGVVEVRDEANNNTFKVNIHQLKPYHEGSNLRRGGNHHFGGTGHSRRPTRRSLRLTECIAAMRTMQNSRGAVSGMSFEFAKFSKFFVKEETKNEVKVNEEVISARQSRLLQTDSDLKAEPTLI
ncbi:hypothetical protein CR513_58835, partial [Mucuna pruriens]